MNGSDDYYDDPEDHPITAATTQAARDKAAADRAESTDDGRVDPNSDPELWDQDTNGPALTGEPLPQNRTTAFDTVGSSGYAAMGDPEGERLGELATNPNEDKPAQDPQPGPGSPPDPYRDVEYGGDTEAHRAAREQAERMESEAGNEASSELAKAAADPSVREGSRVTNPPAIDGEDPDATLDPPAHDPDAHDFDSDQEAWLVLARWHRREGWSFDVLGLEGEVERPELDPTDADVSIGTLWLPRK